MSDRPSPTIAILGGGTAGWMTACLMARAWPTARITVVESPDIGIVGVGEGSTPQLRQFFRDLGIAEHDWMPACNATYKAGIRFVGWSREPGFDSYIHPFASDIDLHTEPRFHAAAHARRTGHDVPAHPDAFFLNSWLIDHRRAPLAAETFPFDAAYGYHFDAHLVGVYLRDHAIGRGVVHLSRTVSDVVVGEDGNVRHLVIEGDEPIAADVFVDCSGFRSVIAQAALGVPFASFAGNLFNDCAVVMPTPSDPTGTDVHTTATALSAGWAWRIPLTSRIGNGYVFSSRYIDPTTAEAELRAHLGAGDDVAARHLTMKVGRAETSWTANCLAVGLAQGFIEPLEATALHIVQATVEGFIAAWESAGFTPGRRDEFNRIIARRYDGIRDYIVGHYRLNRRADTLYWRDAATIDELSDSLKSLFTAWFTGRDMAAEIAAQDIARYYAPLSWGCLFGGYGTYPDPSRLRAVERPDGGHIARFLAACGANFPDHDAALARMAA